MEWKRIFTGEDFMPSWHCIHDNQLVGWTTVALCIVVFVGYLIIGHFKFKALRGTKPSVGKNAAIAMVLIFIFCGLSYLFTAVMLWYPVWYLRIAHLAILASVTWAYVGMMSKFAVVYVDNEYAQALKKELEELRKKNQEILIKANEISAPAERLANTVEFGINEKTSPKTLETIDQMRKEATHIENKANELKELTSKD